MPEWSRREFVQALAGVAATTAAVRATGASPDPRPCRIRTITAGVPLTDLAELGTVERALALLARARQTFENAGYEVETVRIALTPVIAALDASARERALPRLRALDALVASHAAIASVGACGGEAAWDGELAPWIAELIRSTGRLSCSIRVATIDGGISTTAVRAAAAAIAALAQATPEGAGNFRFAAAACVPAGTPFFPVAFHEGPAAIAVGLESASLVGEAVRGAPDSRTATARLRTVLNDALGPVERIAEPLAAAAGCRYLGIDTSPAPSKDRSIGAALEGLLQRPFGGSGSVDACAAITAALRSVTVRTCGYSGLMLPVLEDPVLAQRATEGRFGLRDLLLYSSVCGTGLDLVPLPGDTPADTLAEIIGDTAALSSRWGKPLSARLLLVPGKAVGEMVSFKDPLLTDCRVMSAA